MGISKVFRPFPLRTACVAAILRIDLRIDGALQEEDLIILIEGELSHANLELAATFKHCVEA